MHVRVEMADRPEKPIRVVEGRAGAARVDPGGGAGGSAGRDGLRGGGVCAPDPRGSGVDAAVPGGGAGGSAVVGFDPDPGAKLRPGEVWHGRVFWSTLPGGGDDAVPRSRPKTEGCLSVDGA